VGSRDCHGLSRDRGLALRPWCHYSIASIFCHTGWQLPCSTHLHSTVLVFVPAIAWALVAPRLLSGNRITGRPLEYPRWTQRLTLSKPWGAVSLFDTR